MCWQKQRWSACVLTAGITCVQHRSEQLCFHRRGPIKWYTPSAKIHYHYDSIHHFRENLYKLSVCRCKREVGICFPLPWCRSGVDTPMHRSETPTVPTGPYPPSMYKPCKRQSSGHHERSGQGLSKQMFHEGLRP